MLLAYYFPFVKLVTDEERYQSMSGSDGGEGEGRKGVMVVKGGSKVK